MSSEFVLRAREFSKKFGRFSGPLRALAQGSRAAKRDAQASGPDAWYRFVGPHTERIRRTEAPWAQFRAYLPAGNHVIFDIDAGLRHDARGIALVFFMGMGDYFLATPLIAALRRRYPQVPLRAYVSKNVDVNNAPLVAELIRHNPDIDGVFLYDGRVSPLEWEWKNYDYSDVFRLAPADFLVIPLIYEHTPDTRHRIPSLFETFSLPVPARPLRPIIHLPDRPSRNVIRMMEGIRRRYAELARTGIVFLQLDTRSSGYSYPYADDVARGLCRDGYLVISVARHVFRHEALIAIDIVTFPIIDSIHLLKLLKDEFGDRLSLLTVVSVFWAVSAGLDIRNVGMQHFFDACIHTVWYSNIHVISHEPQPTIPYDRHFLAGDGDYHLRSNRRFADFRPDFVLQCFRTAGDAPDRGSATQAARHDVG